MSKAQMGSVKSRRAIGVVANLQHAYSRDVIRGINRFIQESQSTYLVDVLSHTNVLAGICYSNYCGLISSADVSLLKGFPIELPFVTLDSDPDSASGIGYKINNSRIGEMAAELFDREGVVSYVYFDSFHAGAPWHIRISGERMGGFRSVYEVRAQKGPAASFMVYGPSSYGLMAAWLNEVPKPAGVFCFNDMGATRVIEVCRRCGISVPGQVLVAGVDNNDLLCSLSNPPITSIDSGAEELAYHAVSGLIDYLEGKGWPSNIPAIEPKTYSRESTGSWSANDSRVARALKFIEAQEGRIPGPREVAMAVGCGLRSLELAFNQELKATVQDVLTQTWLKQAKRYLRETDWSIQTIAAEVGRDTKNLYAGFQRFENISPGGYRSHLRSGGTIHIGNLHYEPPKADLTIGYVSSICGQADRDILAGIKHFVRINKGGPKVRVLLRVESLNEYINGLDINVFLEGYLSECDGLIVTPQVQTPDAIDQKVPVITVDHTRSDENGWSVYVDNIGVGSAAAEYFLRRGYRNFAYLGSSPEILRPGFLLESSAHEFRKRGFEHTLLRYGIEAIAHYNYDDQQLEMLSNWIAGLEKPIALFAFNDYFAKVAIEACLRAGIGVPHEVAILGTDNDELICNGSNPSVSSVEVGFGRGGYDLSCFMVELCQGKTNGSLGAPVIHVGGVVERDSTNAYGFNDSELEKALSFIRTNFAQEKSVEDVVAVTKLSRRSIEERAKKYLGFTLLDQLRYHRVQKAIGLLVSTSLPIKELAELSGFENAPTLCRVFKQNTGESPAQYRKRRTLPAG
ncbi:MAG: substrate-binding domain-containing protein [Verrucomicrobiota bacterium]